MPEIIVANKETLEQAALHLAKDKEMEPLISRFGICDIRPHTNYYRELVESIIGQQLSVKAAASINRKFLELYGGTFPSPKQIMDSPVDLLRSAGLSGAKAGYITDLAVHVHQGKIDFAAFDDLDDAEILSELTAVKGIGEWTAHMFLMFCMGRLGVLPVGDLGIRTGIMKLYDLTELPKPDTVRAIARDKGWSPYESVASWYIWASLDNKPQA